MLEHFAAGNGAAGCAAGAVRVTNATVGARADAGAEAANFGAAAARAADTLGNFGGAANASPGAASWREHGGPCGVPFVSADVGGHV